MQKRTIYKIFTIALIILTIIMTSTNSHAGITPNEITGQNEEKLDLNFIDNIKALIRTIGVFISVGALMIIGIKYVMGSLEERANYKKTMIPWIIGCVIIFGASVLEPVIEAMFSNIGNDTETVANKILGVIQVIGSFISVGALMILGIKYMMGSVEERASYKKSMMPYIIGCILIFAAVNLTTVVYNLAINIGKS